MFKKLGNFFKKKDDEPAPAAAAAKPTQAKPASKTAQMAIQPPVARPEISTNSRSVSSGMRPPTEAPSIVRGVQGMSLQTQESKGGIKQTAVQADDFIIPEDDSTVAKGAFGTVFTATEKATNQRVAIKKVLQDRRFKNRELQIMLQLSHPTVVTLHSHFFVDGAQPEDDVFLNLVMEYIPQTISSVVRVSSKAKKLIDIMYAKCYVYQMCRALAYLHSQGICHRDVKPQNLLVDPDTHVVKLCDFGSAKALVRGQPNVAYICSRYYRAPELVFEAVDYTTAIDTWSLGCVLAELMLGRPLFRGESGIDQLIEIIKILGTPSASDIKAMNPNHKTFSLPSLKPLPWDQVFKGRAPADAMDLVSKFLVYRPADRLSPFQALAHPFFNELRKEGFVLPDGKKPPHMFDWTPQELEMMADKDLTDKLYPKHARTQ